VLLAQNGLPNQPYIFAEGKAEIERSADLVKLRFSVVARHSEQVKANEQVQSRTAGILALFDERKIAQEDVIAADVTSEPEYEEIDGRRGKVIGYSVTRSVEARLRDLAAIPKLVDQLLAIPGVEFSAIEPGLSNEKEVASEAVTKALDDARQRAEQTVKATGMKIDSVYALSPVAFIEIQNRMFGLPVTTYGYATTERVISPDPALYRLAPVRVSRSMHVIYLISPAK
jgi:uncharacterized protein